MDLLLAYASQVQAFDRYGCVIAMALLEMVVPRRQPGSQLRSRWLSNFSLSILNGILVRWTFPIIGIAWAALSVERGWGLLNRVQLPGWLAFVLTVLTLDAVFYVQHYLLHRIPFLWRIHLTHHSDHDCDFSTGVRFHPFEAMFSTLVSLGAIALVGATPGGVLVYQLLSVASTIVGHANVHVPTAVERMLRPLVVTPDMHRLHHSQNAREGRSNFSNIVPWWDRLCGTYLEQPAAGHEGMVFGVEGLERQRCATLPWMLAQPLRRASEQEKSAS